MHEMLCTLSEEVIAVLNCNIKEKYALPIDRKDIKVYFGDNMPKSLKNVVQCLYCVFSKSSSLTYDLFS